MPSSSEVNQYNDVTKKLRTNSRFVKGEENIHARFGLGSHLETKDTGFILTCSPKSGELRSITLNYVSVRKWVSNLHLIQTSINEVWGKIAKRHTGNNMF